MKFRDNVERDPEDYGYLILIQKHLDEISNKRKENPDYKKSLEFSWESINSPKAYVYKIKLKDLDIDEGFYTEKLDYVCNRIE